MLTSMLFGVWGSLILNSDYYSYVELIICCQFDNHYIILYNPVNFAVK